MSYILTVYKEYKVLFSLAGFILLVVLFLLFSFFQNQQSPSPTTTPVFIKTPDITPVLSKENITILTVSPKNNTTNGRIFEPITITFSRPLKDFETSSILVTAKPDILGNKLWSNDGTTLTITPIKPLKTNEQYIIKVKYFDQSFLWSFITLTADQASEEDQIKAQSQADQNYGKAIKRIEVAYPWLDSLPLQNDYYFVYFDVDKKQIIALLYPRTASQTSVKDQEENLKGDILRKLEVLGVNTDKYPPKWISKPEP